MTLANDMSVRLGTAYGELVNEPNPFDPSEMPQEFWDALDPRYTVVDFQFDDVYATEVGWLFTELGVITDPGYRPLDVRAGRDVAIKAYIYVGYNAKSVLLREIVQGLGMGRGASGGLRVYKNGRVRIASVFAAGCALRKGYRLHPRINPSRYQRLELEASAKLKTYGSKNPLFEE